MGVGEFTYKLIPIIKNITTLIDDDSNKIGKRIGNTRVISSTEFDYKSNILISSTLYKSKIHSKMFFYVFDLDGTLIDSERIHYNALGWGPDVTFEEYENMLNTTGIQLDHEARKIKNLRMFYEGVQFIPGAEDFINYIFENNLNHVVVTNSSNETVDKFKKQLSSLNKLTNWITREDYKNPKPDPECYMLAIKKFYKNETNIIGFENTKLGKKSMSKITKSIFMISPTSTFKDFIHCIVI